jgi:SAM-dependent methyltransferase
MTAEDTPPRDGPAAFEERARSFGSIAGHYARFRPAPPPAAVDWILQGQCDRVLDLGAGTGALTGVLVTKATDVVAIEPDAQMRAVLGGRGLGAQVVGAVGEALPFRASSFDAALASSSWHWMDPETTPVEVARVLRSEAVLGLLWNHADRSHAWVEDLLGEGMSDSADQNESEQRQRDRGRLSRNAPFHAAESRIVEWSSAFTADELVGLLGSYSRVITLPDRTKERVLERTRQVAGELVSGAGGSTVDLPMRCLCWRFVRD